MQIGKKPGLSQEPLPEIAELIMENPEMERGNIGPNGEPLMGPIEEAVEVPIEGPDEELIEGLVEGLLEGLMMSAALPTMEPVLEHVLEMPNLQLEQASVMSQAVQDMSAPETGDASVMTTVVPEMPAANPEAASVMSHAVQDMSAPQTDAASVMTNVVPEMPAANPDSDSDLESLLDLTLDLEDAYDEVTVYSAEVQPDIMEPFGIKPTSSVLAMPPGLQTILEENAGGSGGEIGPDTGHRIASDSRPSLISAPVGFSWRSAMNGNAIFISDRRRGPVTKETASIIAPVTCSFERQSGKAASTIGDKAASAVQGKAAAAFQDKTAGAIQDEAAGTSQDKGTGAIEDKVAGAIQGEAAGAIQDEAAGTSQDKVTSAIQENAAGAIQEEGVGAIQDEATGASQDKAAGAIQGKAAGAIQDQAAGDVQDKAAGAIQDNAAGAIQDGAAGGVQDEAGMSYRSESTSIEIPQELVSEDNDAANPFEQFEIDDPSPPPRRRLPWYAREKYFWFGPVMVAGCALSAIGMVLGSLVAPKS